MQIGQGILTTIKNIQQVLSSRVFLGAFKNRGWVNHEQTSVTSGPEVLTSWSCCNAF